MKTTQPLGVEKIPARSLKNTQNTRTHPSVRLSYPHETMPVPEYAHHAHAHNPSRPIHPNAILCSFHNAL